jgi:hypothetical protein
MIRDHADLPTSFHRSGHIRQVRRYVTGGIWVRRPYADAAVSMRPVNARRDCLQPRGDCDLAWLAPYPGIRENRGYPMEFSRSSAADRANPDGAIRPGNSGRRCQASPRGRLAQLQNRPRGDALTLLRP